LERRARSDRVRVAAGRRVERRVKRTSAGICRRDWVRVKMFSGERTGRVRRRKTAATARRTRIARKMPDGSGRGLRPCCWGDERALRYQAIALGSRSGPKKRRADLMLQLC
jgi:hypothetical protein